MGCECHTGWHRGTTPTNIFIVNIDLREATIFVTYAQKGKIVLEKTGADLFVTEDTIEVRLSQEDTLKFIVGDVKIQIRYVLEDGTADASQIILTNSEEILKDGLIEYAV